MNNLSTVAMRVTVPYRGGKIHHPKVLKSILRSMDLTVKEFKG